ncbi:MAG: T9SS type B sorting domain-containing protein, partial [Bacteroidota bacterium]
DVSAAFSATSTGDSRFTIVNSWDFDDGSILSGDNVNYAYATGGVYNIELTSSYQEIPGCSDTEILSFTAREIPTVAITTDNPDGFEKCPSDSIEIQLPDNFTSYLWDDGSTTSSIFATTPKDVDTNTISVDWVDDVGCSSSSEVTINNFANSRLTITSSLSIINDTITLGEDVKSVDLSVEFGTNLSWTPVEVIENNTSNDVVVFPSQAFTTVAAEGTTTNNCRETDEVVIVNSFIVPRRTFSPNGDGNGFECWEILNARILNGCTVYIFDSKGVIIQELSSPFSDDNCIWDGNTQGRPAPEGVYYYVLKCDDTNFNRSGSILMAR